jgi:hypothetical protein
MNIPKPSPGYWARIASGCKVKTPQLPPRAQGQQNDIEIWPSTPKSSLQTMNPRVMELVEREKVIDRRIVVSDDLHGAHKLVSHTNKILSKGKSDSYGRLMLPWNFKVDRPILDLRVSKQALHRTLRIMDALIKAMEKRGYQVENDLNQNYGSGALTCKQPRFLVNEERIRFFIREKVTRSEREPTAEEKKKPWMFDKWVYTPNDELTFTIDEYWIDKRNWKDRKNKPLEEQLNDIVAGLISASESLRVRRLEQEAEEQRRQEAALRRYELELRQQLEQERAAQLEAQCTAWLRSRNLRRFLRQCEVSLTNAGRLSPSNDAVRWLEWARAYADSLDPLQNGAALESIRRLASETAREGNGLETTPRNTIRN